MFRESSAVKSLRKIFGLVPDAHVPTGYYRTLWRRHIYDGIRPLADELVTPEGVDFSWARQGHNVVVPDLEAHRARSSERVWELIQAAHRNHGLDAVISYCFANDVELGLVKETIRLGIPWVNFFCDSTHMFEKVEVLARAVSLNWFPESEALPKYQALGTRCFHRPYALTPEFLPELTSRTPKHDVGFIGLPTSNRITQLGILKLLGCPVAIRGQGWVGQSSDPFYNAAPRSTRMWKALFQKGRTEKLVRRLVWPLVRQEAGGALDDAEFDSFAQDCLVVLGLNQGKDSQGRFATYMKFRDAEFPGYGCCYLTQHNADVADAFEVGKEILTYRGMWDAAEQIRRVRRRPERAVEIGRAARRRVFASHTWAVRLRELASEL